MRYAWLTIKHKWFVFLACRRVGGISFWASLVHDWSKFTISELPHYQRQFFGDRGDPRGFALAWLHHQNLNPHHWEYWIPRTGHIRGDQSTEPFEMPEPFLREMIADWMGASRAYTGSWDMADWLRKNLSKIRLHPITRQRLYIILADELNVLDYGEMVHLHETLAAAPTAA